MSQFYTHNVTCVIYAKNFFLTTAILVIFVFIQKVYPNLEINITTGWNTFHISDKNNVFNLQNEKNKYYEKTEEIWTMQDNKWCTVLRSYSLGIPQCNPDQEMTEKMWVFANDKKPIIQFPWTTSLKLRGGYNYSMAIKADGSLLAWGDDSPYLKNKINSPTPVEFEVEPSEGILDIFSERQDASFMLLQNNNFMAQGIFMHGKIVNSGHSSTQQTVRLSLIQSNVQSIDAMKSNRDGALILEKNGKVSFLPQRFGTESRLHPNTTVVLQTLPIKDLDNIIAIAKGRRNEPNLALKKDGSVWQWSQNQYGRLFKPIEQIAEIKNAIDISRNVILTKNNEVWQLNSQNNKVIPRKIEGLNDIVAIATGIFHYLALSADGNVWAWEKNTQGQLGDGIEKTESQTPVKVKNLNKVVRIFVVSTHSFAIKENGMVCAWGNNEKNQLGTSDPVFASQPIVNQAVKVTDLRSKVFFDGKIFNDMSEDISQETCETVPRENQ